MSERRGHARVFLDNDNCQVTVMIQEEPAESFIQNGVTERNIEEFVKVLVDKKFHVSLWRIKGFPQFYAP